MIPVLVTAIQEQFHPDSQVTRANSLDDIVPGVHVVIMNEDRFEHMRVDQRQRIKYHVRIRKGWYGEGVYKNDKIRHTRWGAVQYIGSVGQRQIEADQVYVISE